MNVHYEEYRRQAQERNASKNDEQHLRAQSSEHDNSSSNNITDYWTSLMEQEEL